LGTFTVEVEGPETTVSLSGEVPPSGLAPGEYRPVCILDAANAIEEVDEGNRWVGPSEDRFFVAPDQLTIISDELPLGRVGEPYRYEVRVFGGIPDRSRMTFLGIELPLGLEVSSDGILRGVPAQPTGDAGARVVVEVRGGGDTDRELYTLVIAPAEPLQFPARLLPEAREGQPYEVELEATGGVGAPQFFPRGGTLPPGLLLDASGRIHGTPTALGEYELEVVVRDAPPPGGTQQQVQAWLSITVLENDLRVATSTLPAGEVGTAYAAVIEVEGGEGPYAWSWDDGALPAGLTASPTADTTGLSLEGTPSSQGEFVLEASVTDAVGQQATASLALIIEPKPSDACEGEACNPAPPPSSGGCAATGVGGLGALGVLSLLVGGAAYARRRGRRMAS
jgi:hypothetical protein